MRISEIFFSIQGEGRLVGVPSVFVRTSGCNLRCWFCDTPYTSWEPEGDQHSVDDLVASIGRFDCEHIVLTGGEPMLNADLVPLTEQLADAGHHITIETAGTLDLPVTCHLMSLSPKLAGSTPRGWRSPTPDTTVTPATVTPNTATPATVTSPASRERQPPDPAGFAWTARHDERRHRPDVIRRLTADYDYQLKFVVDAPGEVDEVRTWLAQFPDIPPERVYLMPQATDAETLREKSRWLAEIVKTHHWRLSPRLHVDLWGNQRGV